MRNWTGKAAGPWCAAALCALAFAASATPAFGDPLLVAQLGPDQATTTPGDTADEDKPEAWAVHGQFTDVTQYQPAFPSPYQGANSLDAVGNARATNDATLFLGVRLWKGAQAWVDPEVDQGFGLSDTLGVAGFPSGEAYKVGRLQPYLRWQRFFLRQTIDLGGAIQKLDPDQNLLGGSQTANRLVFTIGKFSVGDVFDTNKYAHDPRADFMNWTVIDTGSFDYAADAWGYTYGVAGEWYQGDWTLRGGLFNLSNVPNSPDLDTTFRQFQIIGELERRFRIAGQPGAVRVTGFLTRGRMGRYDDAVALARTTGQAPDTALVRRYASRGGASVTLEQQVSDDFGVFVRAGVADGSYEAYEFTDVDQTVAVGASLTGKRWGRPDDAIGLAGVVNQASGALLTYLDAGGLGILVGDGKLPHPGAEQILETYYNFALFKFAHLTFDYQFIENPAYNHDRGPVSVFGVRVHLQR